MGDLDEEWLNFQTSINEQHIDTTNEVVTPKKEMPKCSDIYISTKTRTCELNSTIDLYNIFWKLNVIKYHTPIEGIIKKSMKFNCNTEEEVKILEENLVKYKEPNMLVNIISQVNNIKGKKKNLKTLEK